MSTTDPTMLPHVLVNGTRVAPSAAAISVFDLGFQRGFGCFETMRSYGGIVFRRDHHLRRLANSAAALGIDLPKLDQLAVWIDDRADAGTGFRGDGDSAIRVFVTPGSMGGLGDAPPTTIVMVIPIVEPPAAFAAMPVLAPWHAGGDASELTGAKTLSYGPNLAATRAAVAGGFDDAILISRSGDVLEGPTYSVGWFHDGVFETPTLALGILDSITRRAVIEAADTAGVAVREGVFPQSRLETASEAVVLSTTKQVTSLRRLGAIELATGSATERLRTAFLDLVASEQ